jgi:hypothetical protein
MLHWKSPVFNGLLVVLGSATVALGMLSRLRNWGW